MVPQAFPQVAELLRWEESGLGDRGSLGFFFLHDVFHTLMLKTLALYYVERAANGTADPEAPEYKKNDEARKEIEALYDMLGYDPRYAHVDHGLLRFEERAGSET